MAKSIPGQLSMFHPETCGGSPNATSSPGSVDGATPCDSPDGPMIGQSGPEAAPASPSAQPGNGKEKQMNDTFGPNSTASSRSAALTRCLANRLQENLGKNGLTVPPMEWRRSTTRSLRSYYQLAVLGRGRKGSGSGLLPTVSGTSNHGRNHVAGRLDEWGGSSNPFRGTSLGKVHSPGFELWMMGYRDEFGRLTVRVTQSCRKSRRKS